MKPDNVPDDIIDIVGAYLHSEQGAEDLFVEHALMVAVVTDGSGTYLAYRSDDNISQWVELGMLHTAIEMTQADVLEQRRGQ